MTKKRTLAERTKSLCREIGRAVDWREPGSMDALAELCKGVSAAVPLAVMRKRDEARPLAYALGRCLNALEPGLKRALGDDQVRNSMPNFLWSLNMTVEACETHGMPRTKSNTKRQPEVKRVAKTIAELEVGDRGIMEYRETPYYVELVERGKETDQTLQVRMRWSGPVGPDDSNPRWEPEARGWHRLRKATTVRVEQPSKTKPKGKRLT